ncbi:hypothetical protein [Streptococcus sp. CSL10205-OR2]|uniref:hypothetical protein n=1 Tax=Streptococcus sp. CSL10205-OR2 TaxID=2980558 RepID=UPI0021DA9204|nr:hypothetical protein [Streptococcus sp. CSL10205-OR2]MCU9534179.1 hypothetical protein [Streptococcus sp. CSL10205-OR2]
MTAVYWLVLKKRWYVFLVVFVIYFFMNLLIWNETSQFIRNFSKVQVMKIEAQKESFDFVYTPLSNLTDSDMEPTRNKLIEQFSELIKQDKVYTNKMEYLDGGELVLLTEDELKKQFSPGLLIISLNDLILRDITLSDTEPIQATIRELGDDVEIVPFQEQYDKTHQYYRDNMLFSLYVGSFLTLIIFLLLRWLVVSTWRICEEEIKVLRLVGLSYRRLSRAVTFFLYSPILLALLTFIISAHTIFYFGLILWDYVYLLTLAALQFLWVTIMISRRVKGELDA